MPYVPWPASLTFPLGVPGQGLPCDAGCRLAEGVTDPPQTTLKDSVFCRLLSCLLPHFLVADGAQPPNLENPSKAGVDECLDYLHSGDGRFPGLASME